MAMLGHFLRVPRIGFLTRREGRRYRSSCLRISGISLQFGGMMHNNMKQIAIERGGHAWPILHIPRNFEILQNMLGPGQRDDVTVLTFQGFQLSARNLVRWCTVPWSRSGYARPIFRCSTAFFHDRFGPGRWNWGNHITAWNLVAWCSSPWSGSLYEMAILS